MCKGNGAWQKWVKHRNNLLHKFLETDFITPRGRRRWHVKVPNVTIRCNLLQALTLLLHLFLVINCFCVIKKLAWFNVKFIFNDICKYLYRVVVRVKWSLCCICIRQLAVYQLQNTTYGVVCLMCTQQKLLVWNLKALMPHFLKLLFSYCLIVYFFL